MHVLSVIPARLGSTRLPNKPLRLLAGEPLIRWVARRVLDLGLDGTVVVATDSRRVAGAVLGLGVDAVLTHPEHASGTERVAEVARRAEYREADVILNVQGDEPFVPGDAVRGALARVLKGDDIGTAAAPLAPDHAGDPNRVKVQIDRNGHAISFSRSVHAAHASQAVDGLSGASGMPFLHHIGLYAYRRDALLAWVDAEPAPQEESQRLEQLRPLSLGLSIGVALLTEEAPPGIDTEEDLAFADACFDPGVPLSPNGREVRGEGSEVRE